MTDFNDMTQQHGAKKMGDAINAAIAETPAKRRRSGQRRAYGTIPNELWLGTEIPGFLSLSAEAKLAEIYLLSSPHANMLGVYWLPLPYMAREMRLSDERIGAIVEELEDAGMIKYDPTTEHVYVTHFVKTQVLGQSDGLHPSNNQVKGARYIFASLPNTPLKDDLMAAYGPALHLAQ
jgi:hypothetical protein